MKYAIVTRADDNIKSMTDLTHPIMKDYAKRCNADFIVLDEDPEIWTSDKKPHYRILKVRELFDTYDRIALLDSDMVITEKCPNIFDSVSSNMIGSIFEDKGSRAPDRHEKIRNVQRVWGDVEWETGYTNAGTFILSKQHKDIFDSHNGEYWLDWGSADIHMSYMIYKLGWEIQELSFKWNHMTMFSEPWNNNADRFDSYIIHYAGKGIFDKGIKSRNEQIKHDIDIIKGI